jgi:integrative and conjugative element protein (TIGR02256 family)
MATALRNVLQARIGTGGATAALDDAFTIVLLHIPIARAEGEPPEHILRKAFVTSGGALALGEALGAYITVDRKYYSAAGYLGAPPTKWRDVCIKPMEVLQGNTAAVARAQSGIEDEGPKGVLVGAGSLGGTMLGVWGRGGWGHWTVFDNDHIKPHNLARHPALGQQVGRMKADVAAELHSFAMQGANEVQAICADACDFANARVMSVIESAEVVVDASTTLEYPRLASTRDGIARHLSVFVTPSGNSSVMLVEDEKRERRLRTLEAQYYRALINTDWGKAHLEGNLSQFWSGASCRDISVVLPYSKVMAHTATLAEQVRLAIRQPEALIRVWHRDPESGAVEAYQVEPNPEHRLDLGDYDLFVDEGVYEKLRAMRASSLPEETGGILLGYYDLNVNSVVVVDALPAPTDSKSSHAAFERGVAGLKDVVVEAARRTANIVQYIGEWHSHPSGYPARPSTDDSIQLVYLALRMAEDGLPAVQLIVGDDEVFVLQATVRP